MAYIFGGNTGETPSSLKRKRAIAEALLVKNSRTPQNVGEGLSAIGNALLYRSMMKKVDAADDAGTASAAADRAAFMAGFGSGAPSSSPAAGAAAADIGMPGAAAELAATKPAAADMTGNDVYTGFIDTVKAGGLTNPYGLAAVAATGKAESGWSPKNANRSWADPSESGQAGTAGGIMSWRAERLRGLYDYAASKGEKAGAISPQTQAEYFLREDPNLIASLNSAKSVEEAQRAINNAWKFAGYDRPGGEAARRLSLATSYLPTFQGGTEVASLDPAAGMETAAGAIDAIAPPSGSVAPTFDSGRWGDPINLAEMPPSRDELAANLQTQARSPIVTALLPPTQTERSTSPVAAALAAPPASTGGASGGLPVGEVGSTTGRAVAPTRGSAVAQALVGGQQLPSDYFPPAPAAPSAPAGPTVQQAVQLLNNPYATEADKAMAMSVIERQQQMSDPSYQLEQEYKRAQLEALRAKPTEKWDKLDDDTLYNAATGEIREVGSPTGEAAGFRFKGTSVEAQALNGLMDSGQLTPEQAQQLAAGKTITNPADGSVVFLTPQGVFGQSATGGAPQPLQAPATDSVQPPAPPAPPSPPGPGGQAAPAANPGTLQITPGKGDRPTEAQRNRLSSVNQAFDTITGELDRYAELVDQTGIEAIPGTQKDNLNSVRQGIMLQMKELFNLGVLNGPDLSLMERMIYDPVVDPLKEGGIANLPDQLWTSITGGAGQRAKNSVQELKRMLENIRTSVGENVKTAPPADVGEIPDFSKMSDEELERYLNGN